MALAMLSSRPDQWPRHLPVPLLRSHPRPPDVTLGPDPRGLHFGGNGVERGMAGFGGGDGNADAHQLARHTQDAVADNHGVFGYFVR